MRRISFQSCRKINTFTIVYKRLQHFLLHIFVTMSTLRYNFRKFFLPNKNKQINSVKKVKKSKTTKNDIWRFLLVLLLISCRRFQLSSKLAAEKKVFSEISAKNNQKRGSFHLLFSLCNRVSSYLCLYFLFTQQSTIFLY